MASILQFTEYDRHAHLHERSTSDEYTKLCGQLALTVAGADPEDYPEKEIASRLGCYRDKDKGKEFIRCGGWSGLVRIDGQEVAVLPRKAGKGRVDMIGMYLECMNNPVVAAHLDEPAVFFWHDAEPIECPSGFAEDALLLLVLSYLRALHELCLRHLRNQFIRTSENLTGRVKGRIDLARQIRVNLPRGRLDRTACDFTIHSNNCRENQILKTALERGARLLTRYPAHMQPAWSKIHFCRKELGDVEEVEVTPDLFRGLRYSGMFRPYEKAHRLARSILNALPPDPHARASVLPAKVPPFAICTYELFERFCEVRLRRHFEEPRLWVGYQDKNLGRLRPDFLLRSDEDAEARWIIDAKNKPWWRENVNKNNDAWDCDVPQLCRYSRHTGVLEQLGYKKEELAAAAPKMLILYPVDSCGDACGFDAGYFKTRPAGIVADIQNLHALQIPVPTRPIPQEDVGV